MLTRDEAHVLLDAVLDYNSEPRNHEIMLDFHPELDRNGVYANIYAFKVDSNGKQLVESFLVPDQKTVWEAMKTIAKYKEEKENDAV